MNIKWLFNLIVDEEIYEEFESRLSVIYTMIRLSYDVQFVKKYNSQLELSFDGYEVFIHYGKVSKRINQIEIFDSEGDYLFSSDDEIIDSLDVLEDILKGKEIKKIYGD